MKKLATFIGTGLVAASVTLAAPALAAGPGPSSSHSEVGVGGIQAGQNSQGSWVSNEMKALGLAGAAAAVVLAPGAAAGLLNGNADQIVVNSLIGG